MRKSTTKRIHKMKVQFILFIIISLLPALYIAVVDFVLPKLIVRMSHGSLTGVYGVTLMRNQLRFTAAIQTDRFSASSCIVRVPYDSDREILITMPTLRISKGAHSSTHRASHRKVHALVDTVEYNGDVVCSDVELSNGVITARFCHKPFDEYGVLMSARDITKDGDKVSIGSIRAEVHGGATVYLFNGFGSLDGSRLSDISFSYSTLDVSAHGISGLVSAYDVAYDSHTKSVSATSAVLRSQISGEVTLPNVRAFLDKGSIIAESGGVRLRLFEDKAELSSSNCEDLVSLLGLSDLMTAKGSFSVSVTKKADLHIEDNCTAKLLDIPQQYSPYKADQKTRFTRQMFKGDWVGIEDISEHIIRSVIKHEDPGFYVRAKAYSVQAYQAALRVDLAKGKAVMGGSTIPMQLAKNLYLDRHKTLLRKMKELLLAKAIAGTVTKEEMLEWYLNIIEFAPNCYGIRCFLDRYFMHPLEPSSDGAEQIAKRIRNPRIPMPDKIDTDQENQ